VVIPRHSNERFANLGIAHLDRRAESGALVRYGDQRALDTPGSAARDPDEKLDAIPAKRSARRRPVIWRSPVSTRRNSESRRCNESAQNSGDGL
jgi:hypothetical protein